MKQAPENESEAVNSARLPCALSEKPLLRRQKPPILYRLYASTPGPGRDRGTQRGRAGALDLLEKSRGTSSRTGFGALCPQVDDAAQQRKAEALVVLVQLLHLAKRLPQLDIDQLQ